MRHYLPGLGRFISRVHLHEAVAMGRTTYQELREVWGINIGPLGTPEAFARNGALEHPYTYAQNNPANMIDPSGRWCIHLPCHHCIGTRCHGDPYCRPARRRRPPQPPQPPKPQCPPPTCPTPSSFHKESWLRKIIEWAETSAGYAVPGKEFVDAAKCSPTLARLWICSRLREEYAGAMDEDVAERYEAMLNLWCGPGNW